MKKYNFKKIMVCLFCTSLAFSTANAWEAEVAGGATGQSDATIRIGLNKGWDAKFWDSSVGYFSGYWSLGLTHWEKGKYGKNAASISFAPVFTYNFYTNNTIEPFIELGIGVSAFSKTKVGDKNLGSSFNFEDRIGFGARFGDHTLGIRAIHYSNAGIKSPNNGIESYSLYYSYKF
ncbi:acyloxyacyl hydrolase [Wohlfahrtiimonas larvae]|uniref:Lipid A deacylase n=1 Tax=Wohlfahrtiimonas larvae TaxID=1157986 RepID=A0ABP9MLU1_9GAMM|nr:acyloxyacyl hydrolase [Wohlfahrtiimonas larvae]